MNEQSGDGMRPLWFCPRCGKPFANRNSSHSCVVIPLESHFVGRPNARRIFDALVAAANEVDAEPVRVIVSKTRIELMTRARFAAVSVRRDYLRGHLWLKHRLDDPRFTPELLGSHDWVNVFELHEPSDIDEGFRAALREARVVGDQRHPLQARYRLDSERRPADPKRFPADPEQRRPDPEQRPADPEQRRPDPEQRPADPRRPRPIRPRPEA